MNYMSSKWCFLPSTLYGTVFSQCRIDERTRYRQFMAYLSDTRAWRLCSCRAEWTWLGGGRFLTLRRWKQTVLHACWTSAAQKEAWALWAVRYTPIITNSRVQPAAPIKSHYKAWRLCQSTLEVDGIAGHFRSNELFFYFLFALEQHKLPRPHFIELTSHWWAKFHVIK